MFETIRNAKKSIYLEMYIFQNDTEEFDFFDLLKVKGKLGLKIKLILDSFGSVGLSGDAIAELKEAGVEIIFFSYLFHRMHRKILVVDESVAFIGGVNIHKSSKLWNDLMIRIKGKLVKRVMMSFIKSYINAGGKDPHFLNRKSSKIKRMRENMQIIEHSPVKNKFNLKKIYKKYLLKAQKSIILITPYFIPRRWIRASLHQAALRGVNVEILVPETTDHFIIDRVNYFYIYKLSKLGIKFYLEKKINHAKAIIIDGEEAMVGSQNLDFLSFDFNSEIGIFFKNPEMVSKLRHIVEEWKKGAVLFDYKTYQPKLLDYFLSPFISILSFFYRIF